MAVLDPQSLDELGGLGGGGGELDGGKVFSLASAEESLKKKPVKKKKKARAVKIKLSIRKGGTYMVVSGAVPKRYRVRGAKLRFKLKATALTEPTRVQTTVVQKRR